MLAAWPSGLGHHDPHTHPPPPRLPCAQGPDVRGLQLGSLRAAIGQVPQDLVLFNDTIYYNLAYGRWVASACM